MRFIVFRNAFYFITKTKILSMIQQMQNIKPSGSITQGYPTNRASTSLPHSQQGQVPPAQMPQMHYPRHRY